MAQRLAYTTHGFRDLIRDLVPHRDARTRLLSAAGVSAVGDKRRKPWNSMAIPDLRRCWELLLSCGLVSPALAKDVNATTGKVYLTALVEPIARSALEDALGAIGVQAPPSLPPPAFCGAPSSPTASSGSSSDVDTASPPASVKLSPSLQPPVTFDDLEGGLEWDSYPFDFEGLASPDVCEDDLAPFTHAAACMMTQRGPVTVPARSLHQSGPVLPVLPVSITPIGCTAPSPLAALSPAAGTLLPLCGEEECGHEGCGRLHALFAQGVLLGGVSPTLAMHTPLGNLQARVQESLSAAVAAAGLTPLRSSDWCFTARFRVGGVARLVPLLPSAIWQDATVHELQSGEAEPMVGPLMVHLFPQRRYGGGGEEGGMTVPAHEDGECEEAAPPPDAPPPPKRQRPAEEPALQTVTHACVAGTQPVSLTEPDFSAHWFDFDACLGVESPVPLFQSPLPQSRPQSQPVSQPLSHSASQPLSASLASLTVSQPSAVSHSQQSSPPPLAQPAVPVPLPLPALEGVATWATQSEAQAGGLALFLSQHQKVHMCAPSSQLPAPPVGGTLSTLSASECVPVVMGAPGVCGGDVCAPLGAQGALAQLHSQLDEGIGGNAGDGVNQCVCLATGGIEKSVALTAKEECGGVVAGGIDASCGSSVATWPLQQQGASVSMALPPAALSRVPAPPALCDVVGSKRCPSRDDRDTASEGASPRARGVTQAGKVRSAVLFCSMMAAVCKYFGEVCVPALEAQPASPKRKRPTQAQCSAGPPAPAGVAPGSLASAPMFVFSIAPGDPLWLRDELALLGRVGMLSLPGSGGLPSARLPSGAGVCALSPSFDHFQRQFSSSSPSGLHLSLHASEAGETLFDALCLDGSGESASHVVSASDLRASLSGRGVLCEGGHLEYLFLNGCHTSALLADLAETAGVPYLIGWQGDVSSPTCTVMATCFYKRLLDGDTYTSAFEAAKQQVHKFQLTFALAATEPVLVKNDAYALAVHDKPTWLAEPAAAALTPPTVV